MKKLLALLLAMVMVLGLLAGCGNKDTKKNNDDDDDDKKKDKEKETTSATSSTDDTKANKEPESTKGTEGTTNTEKPTISGVPAGTELDAPEKIFDTDAMEDIYISYKSVSGATSVDGEIYVKTLSDESGIFYIVENSNIIVYEVAGETVNRYVKDATHPTIALDNSVPETTMSQEMSQIVSVLSVFTDIAGTWGDAVKYKKSDATVNCPTGPVYVYDVYANGQSTAQLCIDQATGLVVYMKTSTGTISVNSFKTSNVTVPNYK